MEGWIKYYRSLRDHPIRKRSLAQAAVIDTILCSVNHAPNRWNWKGREIELKAGQWITSVQSIIDKSPTGLTRQMVRTALGNLEKANFLTIESTKEGMKITVVNWALYQGDGGEANQGGNHHLTNGQPRPNQDLTTNKNERIKECKKEKYISSKFDSFWEEYPRKVGKQSAKSVYQREVTSEEQEQKILDSLSLQKRIWQEKGTAIEYIPHPEKWLKHKRYEDDFSAEAKAVIKKSDNAHEPDINFKSDEECPPWST